jgi:hypothetical protein
MGKLAKGFSNREVAVEFGANYDRPEEISLGGTQVTGCHFR